MRIHGTGALTHASERVQGLLLRGDEGGAATWGDIYRAIQILAIEPVPGDEVLGRELREIAASVRERAIALVRQHGARASEVVACATKGAINAGEDCSDLLDVQMAVSDLLRMPPAGVARH